MGGGFLRLAFLGWASLLGTFVAESCLAAGCDELVPVPDLCLRPMPVLPNYYGA